MIVLGLPRYEMEEFFGGARFGDEDIGGGEERGTNAEGNCGLGYLVGDESKFAGTREKNGALRIGEGFSEG